MHENLTGESIAQIAAAVAAGSIGLIITLQRVIKGWKETSAEGNILTLMQGELNRMSSQNKILAEELVKFQLEVVKLNNQLTDLNIENHRLHNEVVALTKEVTRLQKMIGENNETNSSDSQGGN